MNSITFKHGATVQLKNLKGVWYELVKPETVQEIQEAEIELGQSKVNELTNARMLEQIATGAERAVCGQFTFYLWDKEGCLQYCRILERLARIELLELDAAVQIQKICRGRPARKWWGRCARKWRRWRKFKAAIDIQATWRGFQSRKGTTPSSWWVEPLKAWLEQTGCPQRSLNWFPAEQGGNPLPAN
jgi:hypothetical protein